MKITVIVNDVAREDELQSEHGLSLWIEADSHRLLFDTGVGGDAMLANAERLGIDLGSAEAIVLSHGHYDHTGGLAALDGVVKDVPVYHGPGAFDPIFARKADGPWRSIGAKLALDDLAAMGLEPVVVDEPREIFPGVLLSGSVPGPPNPRMTGFFAEVDGTRRPDDFRHEIFIMLRTAEEFVLVSGCCHRGLANTLDAAKRIAGDVPVLTVIGGLHLYSATPDEVTEAVEYLRAARVERLFPNHCTGVATVEQMVQQWSGECRYLAAGEELCV